MTLSGRVAKAHRRNTCLRYHGPEAEDSLENTFSCVPKVQGDVAESLRQTDGDA